MLKEVSEHLRKIYRKDMQMVREFLHSLPDSDYMLAWKKRLRLSFGENIDIVKLDKWDWSIEEIFRASFAVMCFRSWSDFAKTEVKLSDLLKIYFVWYIQDCKGCKSEEDYELYAKDEADFINLLRDTYYKIQKALSGEQPYPYAVFVFGDPPDGADLWKRIIAAPKLLQIFLDQQDVFLMPYKLVRDV